MAIAAYAGSTSAPQGGQIAFSVSDDSGTAGNASVQVVDVLTNASKLSTSVPLGTWTLTVPTDWPSSLYKAVFAPGVEAYFVVRAARSGSKILVSVPFATWQAYNHEGTPGQSIYENEQPDRATSVTFDRPTGGPTQWEQGFLGWLPGSGYTVEYCSDLDLNDGSVTLSKYQLLVIFGHDEYWSKERRDAVEAFADSGGNIAFFSGNTCWWQARFENDMRTLVCYRDGTRDPLVGSDDSRVTVEWSSAPVNRPENSLTGVSFRRGAGCWLDQSVMKSAAYTCIFPTHWVFAGTGLANGGSFATGALGYETDAAEYEVVNGVPRRTGRDGTPPSFVILATADLSAWRNKGQGGMATMGVFRRGGGTVFNAATTGWGMGLSNSANPVVERITRNVLDRLSQPYPGDQWEVIGGASGVTAMAACENYLWAADSSNNLWRREAIGQNMNWEQVGQANAVVAMASPREGDGLGIGLYAVTADGGLWFRAPLPTNIAWTRVADAPGIVALAASYKWLFAATKSNQLLSMPIADLTGTTAAWTQIGQANNIVAMTNLNGRLYAVDNSNRLWMRLPLQDSSGWTQIGTANLVTALAGYAGKLFVSTTENLLWWRDAVSNLHATSP